MNALTFLLAAVVAVSFANAEDDYIVCSSSTEQNNVYVLENAVYKCINGQESLEYCVVCDNSNGQSFSANFITRNELELFRDAPRYGRNFCDITNGGGTVRRAASKYASEVPSQECQQQQNWGWGYGRR